MKLSVQVVENHRVDIPDKQILDAAVEILQNKYGLKHAWICNYGSNKGKLMEEECGGSHCYDVVIGDPSNEQIKANIFIHQLKEYAKNV